MANFTQAQLDAYRRQLANPAKIVEYNGKKVEFLPLDDLERVIAIMEKDLGQSKNNGNRFSLAGFNRS